MPKRVITFELSYVGSRADIHEIDFYDVSQALVGFQRSLALTTHLILNGEIITQAPSLDGAHLLAVPAEPGSWKWTVIVLFTGTAFYNLGTAPRDTVLGNLVSSAYDYVISESLGFHVDFEKTLGQQYEQLKRQHPEAKALPVSKFESLVEKCEVAVQQLHRPLVKSETADEAHLKSIVGGQHRNLGGTLTTETFDYLQHTVRSEAPHQFRARISSYNMNTYKGRAYLEGSHRPVPFMLSESARNKRHIRLITRSLSLNAEDPANPEAEVVLSAFSYESRTGRLKWLLVEEVSRSGQS